MQGWLTAPPEFHNILFKHVVFASWKLNMEMFYGKHKRKSSFFLFESFFERRLWVFCFFFLSPHRLVQRGAGRLQPPVHSGAWERRGVLLSPGAPPGLQQQDVPGGWLLHPPPEVQPGVWAVQDHRQVLLLSGMDARRWRGHLPQLR